MTPERIKELRKLSDEWDWPEGHEMTDAIEQLQAEHDRLRAALERITGTREVDCLGDARSIASATLARGKL